MNLKIRTSAFADLLSISNSVVSAKVTLPVLSSVLIKADAGKLSVTSTDLDHCVLAYTDAVTVNETGAICLPVRKLFAIVRELGEGDLTMKVDKQFRAEIRSNGSVYRIPGIDAKDFPAMPATELGATKISLSAGLLRKVLGMVSPAMSMDETRYILNSVFLGRSSDSQLTVVATDGRRLAMATMAVSGADGVKSNVILPSKGVRALLGFLEDRETVNITLESRRAIFEVVPGKDGGVLVVYSSKLVEGTYPDYKKVVAGREGPGTTVIELPREELLGALRRAALVPSDRSKPVEMNFDEETLTITASEAAVGEAREVVVIPKIAQAIKARFSAEFLMDALKVISFDKIKLSLIDDKSPAIVAVDDFRVVVMPMRG